MILPKSKQRRKRPSRPPLRWADIDTSELDRAVDRAELVQAQHRFANAMDARYGPGAGQTILPKVFNLARWVAVRQGWVDAPEGLGDWVRGRGYVGSLPH